MPGIDRVDDDADLGTHVIDAPDDDQGGGKKMDPELLLIGRVQRQLDQIGSLARARVVAYLVARNMPTRHLINNRVPESVIAYLNNRVPAPDGE